MKNIDVSDVDQKSVSLGDSKAAFQRFLRSQYSSSAFLLIIVGNLWLNLAIFQKPGDYTLSLSDPFEYTLQTIMRYAVLLFPVYIWVVKKDRSGEQVVIGSTCFSEDTCPYLPYIEAAFPIMLASLLVVKILSESPGSETLAQDWKLFPSYALMLLPIATFFLLRDIRIEAILLTWSMALFLNVFLSIAGQSVDLFCCLIAYSSVTGFIFLNATRQQKRMFMLMNKLQDTLEMNEKLAVEAQALELRAMIGNVAHDLKTPLTALLSSIEYMHDVLGPWEQNFHIHKHNLPVHVKEHVSENFGLVKTCLNNMRGTNSFMTMTINRCVDFTKASKGFKLVPKLETVSLEAALQMPVQLMRDVQDTIEIEVLPLSAEVCLHVITDKQWLIENLLCLLSNAVKYSHKGCVQVSIRLQHPESTDGEGSLLDDDKDKEQSVLCIEVQDTGIGLSDEAMQGLFNPFKQAQRLAGGTGLGLYSLAMRVEALQGQFGVKGRPDGLQGSVFWFTIPFRPDNMSAGLMGSSLCDSIEAPKGSPHHTLKKGTGTSELQQHMQNSEPSKYNVLVVDDAPMIVKMTSMLLQRKGHMVQHAVNGADALEKLLVRGHTSDLDSLHVSNGSPRSSAREMPAPPQFDVVLMDLQMPVLDGIEAIRRLRGAETRRDKTMEMMAIEVPQRQFVIALSANADEETRQEALSAGADVFISKPFTYDSFVDAIRVQGHVG